MKNTISMNVSAIGTDDGKSTFEVQRTWNEKGKKAIAIGMYPTISVENCGMLDVSNMHLLNHANDFGWGELRMLNLYATVVNGKPSVSQLQGKEYELDIDVEGLIASTPKFVAGLKCLPDLVEIDRKMKVTESTWKKLFRALVDVLSLVDW